MPQRKRPVGVTILALVYLWIGCFGTVFFPFIVAFGAFTKPWDHFAGGVIHSELWLRITFYTLLSVLYLFYVAYAVIGFGLWKLRSWARTSVFVINLIGAAAGLCVAAIFVRPGILALAVLAETVPPFLWMAWYTQRPRVRFAFGAWPTSRDGMSVTEQPPGLSKVGNVWVASALVATFALYICCLLFAVESMLSSSDIYQMTLKEAQNSPCSVKMFGAPLTASWGTTGSIEIRSNDGFADLSIPVHGPRGKGRIKVLADKGDGAWIFHSVVLVHGNDEVQIAPQASAADCK